MSGAYTHEHAGCVVPRVDNPSNPPYNSVCDDTQLPSAGERAGNVDSEHNRKPVDPNEINSVNQLNYGQMAPLETPIGGSETFYQVFKDVPVNPPSHNSSSDAAATAKGNGMSSLPDRSLLDSSSIASSSWVPRTARFSIHPKASPFVIASQNARLAFRQKEAAKSRAIAKKTKKQQIGQSKTRPEKQMGVGKRKQRQEPILCQPTNLHDCHRSKKKCTLPARLTSNPAATAEENARLSGSRAFMKGKERGVGKGPEKKGRKGRAQTSGTDASVVRGPWGRDEDEIVLSEVIKHGTNNVNWAQVAEKIPGRIGKQVRERWFNQLDPSLVWTEFTKEEDAQLIALHSQLGSQWKQISDFMPGRSENQVKNRFNSSLFQLIHGIPTSHATPAR